MLHNTQYHPSIHKATRLLVHQDGNTLGGDYFAVFIRTASHNNTIIIILTSLGVCARCVPIHSDRACVIKTHTHTHTTIALQT